MTQPLSAPALQTSSEGASSNATVGALHRSVWTIVAIVMSVVWFALLDVRKLQHPDEGRYAEIAREMQASGDWVTPRLNGLKYFEKPPLQYWLTAASYKAFELDEWTARLPATIAGWLAIFVVGYAGLRIASPTAGAYAAVVLAGMVWHFGLAHIITLDAMLSFWLTVALCAFLVAQRAAAAVGERRAFMLVAWAAIAGAVLTKGLIGIVIPAGTIVVYTLLTRDIALWRRLEIMWGVALLLAVCAPWFILVSMRNPEFAQFFFVHEHFQRFLTTEHRRTGGWWYFIPLLVVGLLPWVGMFVWTTIRGWRDAGRDANGFCWA
ncbi:MAG TPA: phospholipid carrier-dependent glycosyltransferase, partial [Casimicrobiaceae bacterium]|nr:phospholipid carrier-dependent glycosyltransferase [Casimicrobiaceae bacterium]